MKIILTAVALVFGIAGGLAGAGAGLAVYQALGGGHTSLNVFTIFGFIFGAGGAYGLYSKFAGENTLL